MDSGALFSDDRVYRYALWRQWLDQAAQHFIVIGLNPSTADATEDDPTIRRCIAFAKREHCSRLVMLNLFALRATSPIVMLAHPNPIGDANDSTLRTYAQLAYERDSIVVAAWGNDGAHVNRAIEVRNLFASYGVRLQCFGRTKHQAPRHPLYLAANTPLQDF